MAGINKVILVGYVGDTPETRNFQNGGQVAEFRIATSETWKDKNSGERKERTEWHSVKVFNEHLIDGIIRPYVEKGSLIGVEGELQTETWEKNGEKRYAVKVVITAFKGTLYLLGGKNDGGGRSQAGRDRDDRNRGTSQRRDSGNSRDSGRRDEGYGRGSPGGSSPSFSRDMDDDIPFAPEWRG